MDGRDCIYVKFEGSQTPYFAFGVARIRVADEDLVLSPQELADYIRKGDKEENRWENLVSNKSVDDVDEELLKKYTNQAHDVGRIAIEYTDKRTVLNQLELSEGDNLINAGKALFADDLIQDIQMAIFATNERLTFNDIQRHHGPVLKLVDIAENYIKSNIHWRVEFTGALAGFTLALSDSRLIALTGSITGIAAALSMASSEYLSTKSEGGETKHPIKAAIYTGIAYIITVVALVAPFILIENVLIALGVMLAMALVIIALFNYYYSVARGESFRKRFTEMAVLSFSVAGISFLIGYALKTFTGIDA